MSKHKEMISSEEARIMLLEQKNDDFHQTLNRLENKMDDLAKKLESNSSTLENKINNVNNRLESKIDSHFRWTIGLIFGLYATAFATLIGAVGKAYQWF